MMSKLRAAILVVSETASKDASTDKCIPALQETFSRLGGDKWDASETKIVSDDVSQIQRAVTGWCDGESFANLVVTSGGTGFTGKDVTPEVSWIVARRLSDIPGALGAPIGLRKVTV